MGINCYLVEKTGFCRVVLRRFQFITDEDDHLHNAEVILDDSRRMTPDNPDGISNISMYQISHDDSRWPIACDKCGLIFSDGQWQVNELDWFEDSHHLHSFVFGIGSWDGPAGAMMRTKWRDQPNRPPAYLIFLPNGRAWNTNDYSTKEENGKKVIGPQWDISGEAPNITVSPSINDQSQDRPWHGFIRSGVMEPA